MLDSASNLKKVIEIPLLSHHTPTQLSPLFKTKVL